MSGAILGALLGYSNELTMEENRTMIAFENLLRKIFSCKVICLENIIEHRHCMKHKRKSKANFMILKNALFS